SGHAPAMMRAPRGEAVWGNRPRSGLRPCRYLVTTDDLLVMASETGVLEVPPAKARFKRRIQPGRLFLLDLKEGRLIEDSEIKQQLAARRPYARWLADNRLTIADL